jgi:predicted amidohydrolase YtcJ
MPSSYLITNGAIWTGEPSSPWAQAIVVQGSDLVHVGTRDGAQAYIDGSTELIDLGGGMCLPGFIDSHNHLTSMALSKLGVNLAGIVGRDAVLNKIREWVATQASDAPLRGHAWMPDSFEERSPRREWLDEITGDRPMYLFSADAHDSWFNTAAMHAAGIGPGAQIPTQARSIGSAMPMAHLPVMPSKALRRFPSWWHRTSSPWRTFGLPKNRRFFRAHRGG